MNRQVLCFTKKVMLFISILAAICIALFFCSLVTPGDPNDYMHALLDKHELMKSDAEKRVVFLGGSNLAFGLDSERIEKLYNVKVINFGLHAGLGLKFILRDSEKYIREGDIIIIVPEYEQFFEAHLQGEKTLVDTIINVYPEGIKNIDFKQGISLLQYAPEVIKDDIIAVLKKSKATGVYQRSNFSNNGDMIGHLKERSNMEARPSKLGVINEEAAAILDKFADKMNKSNVQCYFMYPAVCESFYNVNNLEIMGLSSELSDKAGIDILCSPADFVFKDNLFYDSVYHLNKQGREIRTNKMIEILKAVIDNKKI